jgi:hypothetical protein
MIPRLLATAVALTILTVGVVIGLEAAGVLFQKGVQEPAIASMLSPHSPEDLAVDDVTPPQEDEGLAELLLQAEFHRRDAEWEEATGQAADEDRKLADALRWAERYGAQKRPRQQAAVLRLPLEAAANPPGLTDPGEGKPPEPVSAAPPPRKAVAVPTMVDEQRPADLKPAKARAEDRARPSRRQGPPPPARTKAHRAGAGHDGSIRCPFLAWLHDVFAPAASAAHVPSLRRRAA